MITDQKLIAGAKWDFTESFSDYPASTYSCRIIIRKGTGSAFEIYGAADGDDHQFTKAATETAAIPEGTYRYQYIFTNKTDAADVAIPYTGHVSIAGLLSTVTDTRSHNRKMLEALQATAEGRATNDQLSQSYKGRAIQYLTLKELQDAVTYYENECYKEELQEKIENGENAGARLLIGFESNG